MSRYEEVDRLDVETKVDGHGKKEGFHHVDRKTEEDYEDKDTDEEEEANHIKESSLSERHDEQKERRDRSPTGDRHSLHAHNTVDAELEEAKEHVEKERDIQPAAHAAAGDQTNLTSKAEDGGKTDGEKRPSGGHSDEVKEETKLEKPKRDNWRQTKIQPEVTKSKEMNGGGGGVEGGQPHHGTHGRSLTPAAPKKVADKVHSIIEDYTTKMRNNRPEATADRTFVRVGSLRGSESDPKGNISEIRARIERSASSVHTRPPPRRSVGQGGGGGGARDAESIDEREIAELEAKRKKKAEDWLNKFAKPTDGGSHVPPDRSGPLSTPGKSQTSTWKKRELELQKEREEREAAQKQLEEKKKKLDEERRNLRKLKEQDDATKREQHSNSIATTPTTMTTTTDRQSLSHHKYNTIETEKTSRSVQSPGIRSSPLIKSLSISSEDEKLKKQKAIDGRLKPLNIDGLDKDELERKARELYERVRRLEEDKYDLEILLDKRESELNELKVKTGDSKGKFVKPQLKKVIKKDEGATERDDVSFSAKLKADDDDDEPKTKATTSDEHLTRMTSTNDPDDQSDAFRRREDATNHQHPKPPVEQTADSGC